MNSLSKRLKAIASLVDGKCIADVGCDHGKLADYLLENNIIEYAYVSDISESSLNKAIKLLSKYNNRYMAICCDGLSGYKDNNIDTCIISGMGGDEINKIISSSPIKIKNFILSPQHNEIMVKKSMLNSGYSIVYDIIIKDKHKFYNIVKYTQSDSLQNVDEFDLYFGKDNFINNKDFVEYLDYETQKISNIVNQISGENKQELKKYLELLKLAKGRLDNYEKNVGVSSTRY